MSRENYQPIYIRIDNRAWHINGEIVPTGYPMTVDQIVGQSGRAPKGGFDIVRVPLLNEALIKLCKAPGRVLGYLLGHRTYETNSVGISTKELAERAGVSVSTVVRLIDEMEESGVAVQSRRQIWVNPQMIHRGTTLMEQKMYKRFDELMQEKGCGKYVEKEEGEEIEISVGDSLVEE